MKNYKDFSASPSDFTLFNGNLATRGLANNTVTRIYHVSLDISGCLSGMGLSRKSFSFIVNGFLLLSLFLERALIKGDVYMVHIFPIIKSPGI